MESRPYITEVQAWLTPGEALAIVVPSTPPTEEGPPRLCKCGCGQKLPPKRKAFYNKSCQGRWLGKRPAATVKTAPEEGDA